ncbi:MAG TPA: hypothetical protein VF670_13260 [Duganella sp.]|jgi:hypothetical protein
MALATAASAGAVESVSTADMLRIMPPPGLYRIDIIEDDFAHLDGPLKTHSLQTNDVITTTYEGPESKVTAPAIAAPQPTVCVPPRRTGPPALRLGMEVCKTISTTASGDMLSHVAQCKHSRISHTTRRLSGKQWKITDAADWGGGMPDPKALRPMVENLARNGATEADRKQAKALLTEVPRIQADAEQQMAAALAGAQQAVRNARTAEDRAGALRAVEMMQNPDSVPPQFRAISTSRWTRIGDNCAAGQR